MPVTETIGLEGELSTPKGYQIENIMSILKGNEPKVITELLDSGEMNQAELAARIGIPRVDHSVREWDEQDGETCRFVEKGSMKLFPGIL